ncbi:tetratricopeptide repeat-containing sulfotransferase family protein [Dyella sp.]|uniref:tetratricopeptide repeat-containing sulfotransferase family protein n=1 Tax=Dyella sp. TaxID=1869338 RepID=UPI002B49266E|nr:sulfotransferase [Dyella sp.]HKT30068.1 sulfotransferase [Dyella sp.]
MTEMQLRERAMQRIEAEQWEEAQAVLEALVRLAPRDVRIRIELANVILRRGRMREATGHLLQAIPMLPNHAPLIAQLAWCLSLNGEVVGARACLSHLERAPDPPAEVLVEQAHLRWMLGEIPAALKHMDRAAAMGIEAPNEHYLYGMLLQFMGNIAKSEQLLLDCLRRWPHYGDAAVILANLRKQTMKANHLDFLRQRLAALPDRVAEARNQFVRAEFESAVYKILDDLGRDDEAWHALASSNARMHAIHPYDAAEETAVTDALIAASQHLDARPPVDRPSHEGPTPIFIVGMPRSGTTLLDHMLSAHSQVVSAGEINDFQRQLHWVADVAPNGTRSLMKILEHAAQIDYAEVGARYLKQTQWRAQGRRFYIDKLPINVRMVPFIRCALPTAPILHLVRDPMDVCYSNFKIMFGSASPYCYDMQALAHYYAQYARLAEQWRNTMPDAMFDVSYSMLVTESADTMRHILGYCGLDVEDNCVHPELNEAPVATPSSAQIREPVHRRGLGQWRRYAQQLEPLRQALMKQSVL